jgi:hypothetical protein
MNFWKRKLDGFLHDPPEKVLDLAWHKRRAEAHAAGHLLEGDSFDFECDHAAAAADRLPWPTYHFLESAFDGRENHFKHPLGGAGYTINPYSTADIAHEQAWQQRPVLKQGDDRAQFFAYWRFWRWWASDQRDPRLAFLPADTRLPDHTIWTHNSIVSALQGCVVDGYFQPAFLLMHIGPVQEYIAQARRTLDLWSGSYLLSYLLGSGLKHIALNYGPDCVIFPNLCGQPLFDLLLKDEIWAKASTGEGTLWDSLGYDTSYARSRLLTPSLPHRFLALVPAGENGRQARQIAQETANAMRDQYKTIAKKVWGWAAEHLKEASDFEQRRDRFMAQTERFLEISWQVLPGELTPDAAFEKTGLLPESSDLESGPRSGLHTILEIARRVPKEHRDVRNFECERFTDGPRKGWKDKSKLKRDAKLDNAGAAWSALYRKVNWELDAVRQTRAWKAWADGGWSAGREQNKDSLNGREEAVLDLSGDEWSDTRVETLNEQSGVVNLFKKGEILGASSLIKRLWPSAWLEPEHGFKQGDWRMPDTRRIAEGQPFRRDTADDQFDADADETADDDKPKYFAVLALDGDEMGKWVSGTHPKMPLLGDQLSDYRLRDERKGARVYFEQNALGDLLKRKRPLNPSYHLQFSEMLANFSNFCVRRIVESFDGRLIYSGGDDVLAMLPATTALACAKALRAAFRGEPEVLNALTGAWRVRPSGSEKDNTAQLFQCEQPGFIQLERTLRQKGFALEGEPGKFAAMVPGPAADASVGIAIAHFKSPLQDVVRAAQDAEKRAKKELGRSAVAVTLFKRSGETIEWGCKWAGGGLELYRAIADALNAKKLSAKFPYRAAELLLPYLTETSQLTRESQSLAAVEGFDKELREIVRREFGTALSQQTPLKGDEKKALTDAVARKLEAYLQHLEERFADVESKFQKRLSDGQAKPWERPRKPDFICGALIGLCQTVAFANRTRGESANPQPTTLNPQSV